MGRLGALIGVIVTIVSVPVGATPPTAAAAVPAITANQLRIDVPALVAARAVYDITVTGTSLHRATLHLFVDYAGCARSAAAEERRAPHASDTYRVLGTFAELSGWRSSSPGTDHACAYLVSRRGVLLASRRVSFRIH